MGGSDRPPGGESFGSAQEGVASGDLYLPLSKEVLGWGAFPEAYRCVLADTQTSPREGKGEAAPVMGVEMGGAHQGYIKIFRRPLDLVVQWLRPLCCLCRGPGFNPWWGK